VSNNSPTSRGQWLSQGNRSLVGASEARGGDADGAVGGTLRPPRTLTYPSRWC